MLWKAGRSAQRRQLSSNMPTNDGRASASIVAGVPCGYE